MKSSSVPPSGHHRGHDGHHHGHRRRHLGLQIDLPDFDVTQWNGKTALPTSEELEEDDDGYGDGYGDDDVVFDDNHYGHYDDDDHYDGHGEDNYEDAAWAPRTQPKVKVPKFALPMPLPSEGAKDSMEEPTRDATDADGTALLLTPPLFASSSSEEEEEEEDVNYNSNSLSSEFESIPAPPVELDAAEAGDDVGESYENEEEAEMGDDEKAEEMEPVAGEEEKDVEGEATKDMALLAEAEGEGGTDDNHDNAEETETIVDETNSTGDNDEMQESKEEEQQPQPQPQPDEINDTANERVIPPDPETTTNQPTDGENDIAPPEESNDVPEINDQTVQPSWEGFDDIHDHDEHGEGDHDTEPDVDSSSYSYSSPEYDDVDASAPASSLRPDELAYEGDGFHDYDDNNTNTTTTTGNDIDNPPLPSPSTNTTILRPLPLGAILALATLPLLCYLCHRCRRRRFLDSQKKIDYNRGRYAAIAGEGEDDFFANEMFSEDVSFQGKESDEENSIGSFGSDDGAGGAVNGNGNGIVRIEMGGIHETDQNGGLTLEEING